jgi:anti-anti-sigma regulatory factor
MGMLVRCARTLRQHGAPTVFLSPPSDVRAVLEATGIHHVVPMVDGLDQAKAVLETG